MGNLKIRTRLSLGIGVIILFVFILGWISLNQAGRLWLNTDNLFSHPYQVGISARNIRINLLEIHRIMKDIGLNELLSETEIKSLSTKVDSLEKLIYEDFTVVSERFLGPTSYVDTALHHFQEWKKIRDDLFQTRLNSGFSEARTLFRNVNIDFVSGLNGEIEKVTSFATGKGKEFYSQALQEKTLLLNQLIIVVILIILVSVIVTHFTIRSISRPLSTLNDAAEGFKSGNYDSRSSYISGNELGVLSATFNEMASVVQTEISVNENIAKVSGLLMTENELRPFCRKLCEILVNYTNSQVVAVFIRNEANGYYENFESTGLDTRKAKSFDSKHLEGEIGNVLTTGKIMRMKDIPSRSILSFNAVTGDFIPADIISIPVRENGNIPVIISISSINPYTEDTIRLIEGIWNTLSSKMVSVLSFQRLADLSAVLEKQNSELEEKSKELGIQSEELKEYNIELELQKRQLNDANRLKSAFLSNMSHELRTPLNSVIALSGVLSRRMSGKIPDDEYGYLRIIEKNGKNLLSLINNILDLSRIEAGREEISLSVFSPGSIIEELVSISKPACDEKGITISFIQDKNIPDILSDRKKCLHIFQNLISNAVKFTEKGSVDISAAIENDFYTITVRDTGVGIPAEFLPFIFDEFRQADEKYARKYEGTGLGLAIVKKYCKLLNGDVSVESVLGIGSVFKVRLPIRSDAGNSNESEQLLHGDDSFGFSQGEVSGRTEKAEKKILVVEDNEAQIVQIRDLLNREGFIFEEARNGQEALESVRKSIPDAMILDLQMPVLNGFEVLNELRSINGAERIPVIVLSANELTKADLKQLKNNNIHQYIQKGNVNLKELKGYINKIFPAGSRESGTEGFPEDLKSGYTGNNTIMIIEDNPDNLATFNALLAESFNVVCASDGISVVAKAREIMPAMILLDISLPGKDGFKIFDEIRSDRDLSGIPVIALTARAMKGDREMILGYGFDGYISKPVEPETFENNVRSYLNKIKK